MSKKKFFAVMHVAVKDSTGVFKLTTKVIKGLGDNPTVFTNQPAEVATLPALNKTLGNQIAGSKGDHKVTTEKIDTTKEIYDILIDIIIPYVNITAKHDKATIELSGFDASTEPQKHGIPIPPVIKKITDWKTPHSAKIFLVRESHKASGTKTPSPQTKQIRGVKYNVYTTQTPLDDASWVLKLKSAASTKLTFEGLPKNIEISYRVTAVNSAGESKPSNPVSFSAE